MLVYTHSLCKQIFVGSWCLNEYVCYKSFCYQHGMLLLRYCPIMKCYEQYLIHKYKIAKHRLFENGELDEVQCKNFITLLPVQMLSNFKCIKFDFNNQIGTSLYMLLCKSNCIQEISITNPYTYIRYQYIDFLLTYLFGYL